MLKPHKQIPDLEEIFMCSNKKVTWIPRLNSVGIVSLTVSFRCIKTGLGPFSPSCRCCFSSPAKATDICKSCRVQLHAPDSSLTHGNLAGGVQDSHAGLPQKKPDYSLACAHLLSKEKKIFFNSQTVLCFPQSP